MISTENFSHWFDVNRDLLIRKYRREIALGETDSIFHEWLNQEFQIEAENMRIEIEHE